MDAFPDTLMDAGTKIMVTGFILIAFLEYWIEISFTDKLQQHDKILHVLGRTYLLSDLISSFVTNIVLLLFKQFFSAIWRPEKYVFLLKRLERKGISLKRPAFMEKVEEYRQSFKKDYYSEKGNVVE